MNTEPFRSRRAVLAGVMAFTAAPLAAAGVTPSLAAMWAEAAAMAARPGHLSDEEGDRLTDLETAVLRGVITCRADALAKLKAVALSFERGELTDGSDARALADATAWLEAH